MSAGRRGSFTVALRIWISFQGPRAAHTAESCPGLFQRLIQEETFKDERLLTYAAVKQIRLLPLVSQYLRTLPSFKL